MKIIFMGTPDFAVPSLDKLRETHEILCVVTQPDRPQGRGMKLMSMPIKFLATQLGLKVFQPEKISGITQELKEMAPELVIVVACGHILTKEILAIPKLGCLNLHASLLPQLRGPEPITWSIIKGMKKTGITTMWMNEGIDTGDIVFEKEIDILPDDTKGSLEKKMSFIGADLLFETIKKIENGSVPRIKQSGEPTFAPIIKKSECAIDWKKQAEEIRNFVRGLNPDHSAYTFIEGKRIKIHKVSVSDVNKASSIPGEVVEISGGNIFVGTGSGAVSLDELQPEGKRVMTAKEYLAGHKIEKGMRLSE